MKYTYKEIKIRLLEDIQERHEDLMEYWLEDKSNTELEASMIWMKNTFENMDIILSDLIENE